MPKASNVFLWLMVSLACGIASRAEEPGDGTSKVHGATGNLQTGGIYKAAQAGVQRAALNTLQASSPPAPAQSRRWDFEDAAPGRVPDYVDAPRGRWEVQEISDAPLGPRALVQVAQSPGPYFNLAVMRDTNFRDLRLSVKLKPLAGNVDQGGGVVWRYRDPENYYVARANPLEHNFRLYRVVGGKREMLLSAETKAEAQKWHTISVIMRGDQIICELDGRKYLEAQDKTFPDEGRVGLWTKADASTAFDELQVESF